MLFINKDKKQSLPYVVYYVPALLLCLSGTAVAVYLSIIHYKNYTDPTFSSFCAISKSLNCDTVAQSPWSILFGMPISIWGVVGYTVFFGFCLVATKTFPRVNIWTILIFVAGCFSVFSIYLGYISSKKISSYCILCIISYAISFLLLLYSIIIWRRFGEGKFVHALKNGFLYILSSLFLKIFILLVVLSIIGVRILLPQYWLIPLPSENLSAKTGFTADGNPWIGSDDAEIVIEEFLDYMCFQCIKVHSSLRKIINQNPKSIKLIHHHYPLDSKYSPIVSTLFHEGSGDLALFAIAAGFQDKFWETSDQIFEEMRQKKAVFDLQILSEKIGLNFDQLKNDMYSRRSLDILEDDIKKGLRNEITSTPTYIINGQVYKSMIPIDLLEKIKIE